MIPDTEVQITSVYIRGDQEAYVACCSPEFLLVAIDEALKQVALGNARVPWVRFPNFRGETIIRADLIVAVSIEEHDDDEEDIIELIEDELG